MVFAMPFIECCAEPFIALRAIHVGLAPNKSKIKNSRKSINVLPAVFYFIFARLVA